LYLISPYSSAIFSNIFRNGRWSRNRTPPTPHLGGLRLCLHKIRTLNTTLVVIIIIFWWQKKGVKRIN